MGLELRIYQGIPLIKNTCQPKKDTFYFSKIKLPDHAFFSEDELFEKKKNNSRHNPNSLTLQKIVLKDNDFDDPLLLGVITAVRKIENDKYGVCELFYVSPINTDYRLSGEFKLNFDKLVDDSIIRVAYYSIDNQVESILNRD